MTHDQLLKENSPDTNQDLVHKSSPLRNEQVVSNQKEFDMNFESMPYYKLNPTGINQKFIKDFGMLDFDQSATGRSSILNLSRLFLRRYTVISFFESVDDVAAGASVTTKGWDVTSTNSGVITAAIGGVLLDTGVTGSSVILLESAPSATDLDFDKYPSFSTIAQFTGTTNITAFLGVGDFDTGATGKYIGFKITGSNTVTGVSNDGAGEDTVSIANITTTNWNIYTILMTSGKRVDFLINNKLVGSIISSASVTLPSGTAPNPIQFRLANNSAAESKTLRLRSVVFNQDI